MSEKIEWEVVDEAGPRASAGAPPSLGEVLKAMLGRHWRWKIAGAAIVGTIILALILTLTGVVALVMVSVAVLSVAISKLRRWIGRDRRSLTRGPF